MGAQDVLQSMFGGGGGAPAPAAGSGGAAGSLAATFGSSDSTPAAAAPSGKAKPSGNIFSRAVGDIGSMIVHAPAGLVELAKDTGRLGVHAGENIVNDVAGTHLGPASGYRTGGVLPTQAQLTSTLNANPAYRGIVQGYKQLGNEVAHPTQLAADLNAHPIGTLVNAVADLAPGAKALGLAGEVGGDGALAAAARGVGKAGHVADKVISAPIAGPMKLPRLAGNAAYDRALAAAAEGKPANPIIRTVAPMSEPMHAVSTANLEGAAHEGQVRSAVQKLEAKVATILPSRDEQAAWFTHMQGESPAYALLQRHVPGAMDEFLGRTNGTLSPAAAKMAADVANGRNPELAAKFAKASDAFDQGIGSSGLGSLARMDEAYTNTHPWQGGFEANPAVMAPLAEQGVRRVGAALKNLTEANDRAVRDRQIADLTREASYGRAADKAQAAMERSRAAAGLPTHTNQLPVETPSFPPAPASPRVQGRMTERARAAETAASTEGRLAHPNYKVGVAEDQARQSAREVTRAADALEATRRQVAADHAAEANKIANAPSRLRPALETNRGAVKLGIAQANALRAQGLHEAANRVEEALASIPITLRKMSDEQFEARYLPHTQEGRPAANTFGPRNKQALPKPAQPDSFKQRDASPVYDRSAEGVAKGITDRGVYEVRQATAEKIAHMPFVARLNEGPLAGVLTKQEAEAHGYVPWQPGALFDKAGNVRGLDDYDARLGITGDTPFVPKPIFDAFRNYFEPRHGDLLRLISTPGNKLWMMTRLAFSPALITGRLIGHTMLALAHSGHNPIATYRAIGRAFHLWQQSGPAADHFWQELGLHGQRTFDFVPPRIPKAGSFEAEAERLRAEQKEAQATAGGAGIGAKGRQLPGPLGAAARGLGAVNAKVDQAAAFTLHAAGFWDNLNRSAFYLIEKGKGASDENAVRAALRATGEFDRMTPFERDYLRAIVPFWSWHREITRIAAHMAEDNPLKTAWLLHLGDIAAKNELPLPSYDQGDIPIGNNLVSPGFLVPFTEAGSPFGGGLAGLGKVMGPLPRLALTNVLTHENPSTGKPYYMPPGTPTVNGNPAPPSIVKQLASMLPQVRLAGALTGADKIDRYQNGEPVLTKANGYQPQPTGSSPTQGLLGLAGITTVNRGIAEKQGAAQQPTSPSKQKSAKAAAKAKANYEGRKRSLFGG